MGQELAVPAAFAKGGMSQAFASHVNAQADTLAAGIGQSYGVINYKGKVWSGRYRGERKNFLRPDDGTPASYLDVIILGAAEAKSKSYYESFDQNQSEGARPICASMDGLIPDADVTTKQSDTCALCPRNAWKTQPNGRKGRECTDYKRLAVLVLPTQTKPTFGQPIMEPMFLRVPPDSLNSLAIMGETMSNQGHHYVSYITRITFDPQKAHPCMVFRPLQPLTDAEAPVIIELSKDPMVARIITGETGGMKAVAAALAPAPAAATGLVATAQTQPTPQPQPAPVTPQQQPQAQTTTAAPATVSSGLGLSTSETGVNGAIQAQGSGLLTAVVPPATQSQTTSAVEPSTSGLVDTGFGGANIASPALQPSLPQQTALSQTAGVVADTGAPEASDEELDAKIAALIAPK